MISIGHHNFYEVWLVDFEFRPLPGEIPVPICLVAKEFYSGRELKIWETELIQLNQPPYSIGNNSLFVAYYASAEMGCHLALNWSLPEFVLDLFVEFRTLTNGLKLPCGNGLLGAMTYLGLSGIEATEKNSMRDLALRGGPWTLEERAALIDYCASDVHSLKQLFQAMLPEIDLPRALLRGRYMKAAASIENCGVPVDASTLNRFNQNWESIKDALITEVDTKYGVYEGRTFKRERFAAFLEKKGIPWPLLPSGCIDLKEETFRRMAQIHPEIRPLKELRSALSQMRLQSLSVGSDGRNRTILSAFQSRTGRNQPSSSKFIFGQASWLRGLIKPKPGSALAYIDWSQQEFGIAAALSEDKQMMAAYSSGDPYLEFAKQCSAIPSNATKDSHPREREQFKACVLGVQYGMGPKALAVKTKLPEFKAKELLKLHHETYPDFWRWSDSAKDYAMLNNRLHAALGWEVKLQKEINPRFLQNFPMQANGAEMLRLACCLITEQGIRICSPVHDAILIEASEQGICKAAKAAQNVMAEASAILLNGFELRTDVKIIHYPDRFKDKRGTAMWSRVWCILQQLYRSQPAYM